MVIMAEQIKGKYLLYKGLPLVRENNLICYGNMKDKYVLFMMILSYKDVKNESGKVNKVPEKIIGQIVATDPNCLGAEKIVRNFEKNGLFSAFAFGEVLLKKYNKE